MGVTVPAALRLLADALEEQEKAAPPASHEGGMTYARAAQLLDCHVRSIGKMVKAKLLEDFAIGSRGKRVTAASVHARINNRGPMALARKAS